MRPSTIPLIKALMKSARARQAALPAAFEALEPRSLLSVAVTSQFGPVTHDRMVFYVHFATDGVNDPVNYTTTIPVGVTGPSGLAQILMPYSPQEYYDLPGLPVTQDGNGGLWARYALLSPTAFLENGTYTIGVAAGAVHTEHGLTNATGGAGQAYLWFPDSGFGSISGDLAANQLRVSVERWDRNAPGALVPGEHIRSLELTGPDGQVIVQDMTGDANAPPSDVYTNGTVYFNSPGGSWDYADNGTYTVRAPVFDHGVRTGSVVVAQWYLFFGPRAEMLSSQFTQYQWSITVRYTGANGIALSTVNNQNAYFSFGQEVSGGDPVTSRFGQLAAPPTVNQDGSVDATYLYYTGPQGFTTSHSGTASVAVVGVYGSNGVLARGQSFDQRTINSQTPLIANVDGSHVTATRWTISFDMGFRGIDSSSFSADDLRIEGPGGLILTPTSESGAVNDAATLLHMTYTITRPGGATLPNGEYHVFLRAGALDIGAGHNDEVMLGSWWLWFE